MKQVLWINSCMRGAGQSRTLELCRTFLEELRVRRPGLKVAERGCAPQLLQEARQAAEQLLAQDPALTSCPAPAKRVTELIAQQADALN